MALFDVDSPGPTITSATDRDGIHPELLADRLSRRPILLIGDIGVGKTTFIRHLINVEATDVFANAVTLYLDLGSQATLSGDLRAFIVRELIQQLRTQHGVDIEQDNFVRAVYHPELCRFRKGIYGRLEEADADQFRAKEIKFLEDKICRPEEHVRSSLEHLSKGRSKQIVVFLDNADQRGDALQNDLFLIAQEMAEHWPATVFVTLRPETFHRSAKSGVLSGYHPKAFTVSPPRVERVIKKRLAFAIDIIRGRFPSLTIPEGTGLRLEELATVIRVFSQSLDANAELVECIDNIAGGNVRLALDLVRGFFGSGHVDTEKIVGIFKDQGSYTVPLHEFLRAVIFGDTVHYSSERSPIANLFDVAAHDPREHFLLPLTLALLRQATQARTDHGFVETGTLYEHLQGMGFTADQVDFAIVRAHRKNLVETPARQIPEAGKPMPRALRATTLGLYHEARLCAMFAYVDAMIVATPIFDLEVREQVCDVNEVQERLKRAETFRQYLDKQWDDFGSATTLFDWNRISEELHKDIEAVAQQAGKGGRRQ
ncbi:MAG: hypothetical protein A2V70_15260 [Planctomycetes bacterium RBG_13_63_9]|nr:MAG: hypothetical protein A2V70_15260 [Planctomycetes bacterium RBG_13_63_9]